MQQLIQRIVRQLTILYALVWLTPILLLAYYELQPEQHGLWADNVRASYLAETITILLTALCVPLSLKLFAWALPHRINSCGTEQALQRYSCWSMLRLLLLWIPVVCGMLTYYLCLSYSGLFCALIALVATLFCRPSQKVLTQQINLTD